MKDTFYIFGIHSAEEAIINNLNKIEKIYFNEKIINKNNKLKSLHNSARINKIPFSFVGEDKLNEYSGNSNHQGVVILMRDFDYLTIDDYLENINVIDNNINNKRCLLILDNIQDTHNMGAIIRSATALGVDAIILEKYSGAPLNGTVHKTSAGTLGKLPIISVNNLSVCIEKLKKNNFWIYSLAMSGDNILWKEAFPNRICIVVGNEDKGVSKNILEHSDVTLSIPMSNNTESLNASIAAALTIYEWRRE